MDAFFNTLKKGLVAMLFVVVGFSMTYVPQLPSSQVQTVHAGPPGGGSTLFMQTVQNASALAGNAINTITSVMTGNLWLKENVLDGIGWAIAKRIVSGMVRSLINWVNSGFQGSPAFVSDLKGFLLNIADEEMGRIVSEMGDVGSFICSPFRLDVQISLSAQYAQGRTTGQSAPTCTITGIIDNIEGFISGIDPGNGISDWLQITSAPQTNTPYGAVLNAEVAARARLINAEGQVLTEVNWGDGFLSQKICEAVGGTGGQQCTISKPGRIIADQINKALGAGQDALIEADEINELISALLGQLANKALTGVAGLLGLSGGNPYSYSDYDGSYLDELVAESDELLVNAGEDAITDSVIPQLQRQIEYRDVLLTYQTAFTDFLAQPIPPAPTSDDPEEQTAYNNLITNRQNIEAELEEITNQINQTEGAILQLVDIAYQYEQADAAQKVELLLAFTALPRLTESEVSTERDRLSNLADDNNVPTPANITTSSLTTLMATIAINPPVVVDPTDQAWITLADNLGLSL